MRENNKNQEDLDLIISNLFKFEDKRESVLNKMIDDRIQTKALPLALRKRLLYERALAG